jgi:YbgC/YbaW family acyl-CoA thioester hydrolase
VDGPFRWKSRIRFVDTDASQRIHYTAMFRHFEAAEQDFLHAAGLPFSAPELAGFSFPRVHVECDFSAEIRYDDKIEIEMRVERVGTSSYTLQFVVFARERAAAKGRITVVCVDRHTQRACPVPDRLTAILRRLLA